MTEKELESSIQQEVGKVVKLFEDSLNVDEEFATALSDAGFTTLEEVAYVEPEELLAIDGMDEETASQLQEIARKVVEEQRKRRNS